MTPPCQQSGMVLLLALSLLMLLSVLVLGTANLAALQQRMAYNSHQQNIAFQAAETGLRRWLDAPEKAGEAMHLDITDNGSLIARAKVRASAEFDCTAAVQPSPDPIEAYICQEITSLAKACADPNDCDVTRINGQARAQLRRSGPPRRADGQPGNPVPQGYFWIDQNIIE